MESPYYYLKGSLYDVSFTKSGMHTNGFRLDSNRHFRREEKEEMHAIDGSVRLSCPDDDSQDFQLSQSMFSSVRYMSPVRDDFIAAKPSSHNVRRGKEEVLEKPNDKDMDPTPFPMIDLEKEARKLYINEYYRSDLMEDTSKPSSSTLKSSAIRKAPTARKSSNRHENAEEYIKSLPQGWTFTKVERRSGASIGKFDTYYFSPGKRKFRSKVEVERYFEENGTKRERTVSAKNLLAPLQKRQKTEIMKTIGKEFHNKSIMEYYDDEIMLESASLGTMNEELGSLLLDDDDQTQPVAQEKWISKEDELVMTGMVMDVFSCPNCMECFTTNELLDSHITREHLIDERNNILKRKTLIEDGGLSSSSISSDMLTMNPKKRIK